MLSYTETPFQRPHRPSCYCLLWKMLSSCLVWESKRPMLWIFPASVYKACMSELSKASLVKRGHRILPKIFLRAWKIRATGGWRVCRILLIDSFVSADLVGRDKMSSQGYCRGLVWFAPQAHGFEHLVSSWDSSLGCSGAWGGDFCWKKWVTWGFLICSDVTSHR